MNIVVLVKELDGLFKGNSRNVMSGIVTTFVIECCVNPGCSLFNKLVQVVSRAFIF